MEKNAASSIFLTLLIFLAGGSFAAGMASTEASSTAVLSSYVYDKAYNRTSRTIAGVTTASVFGNGNNGANSNQLISYGAGTQPSVSFTYDANGNRATKTTAAGTENYTWDFEQCARKGSILDGGETIARRVNDAMPRIMNQNRLTQLTKPGVGTYQYQYDFRSSRVTRDESQAGGLKTVLTFSGGSSVQEASAAGVLITELIRGSDWGGGVGGILYSIRSGARSYNGYNSRGDVVSTTSDSGSANWQASYEAFGKRTAEQGTNVERQRGNTKDEDPTGLLNEGFRYRDLETGEFISRDPMGFIDGPNVYAYTMQNPWSGFDPEGLYEKDGSVTNDMLEASKAIQMNPSRSFGDSMKAMGLGIAGAVAIVPEAVSFSFKGAERGLAQANIQVGKDIDFGKINPVMGGVARLGIEVFGEGSLAITGAALLRPVHEAIVDPSSEKVFNAAASLIIVKGAGPEGQSARGASVTASAEANVVSKGGRLTPEQIAKETGSYTNTHASGTTYHGKGSRARSQASGRREAKISNDQHVATDWQSATSKREAFKQESLRLDGDGGPSSVSNYNRIEQPGKKYRKQDGDP
jgi:RHS repeat-associated protein